MNLTLMSLFDGSGGFPLAGAMHSIVPVYAAEVEPYPIAVTRSRFPNMRHLGSVTEINGAELEPVDVVTFGSPCQDLSVAGLQKGIHDGERSNLFFQAVRIIKELRDKDARTGRTNEHIRPRFAVWENVPGAYSSNGGHDFQAVLQALAEVADPDVSIPFPEKGKWTKAGCIVGDGWSIAWRTLDAQFWGVPQRRKRIYLVADFGSERAGEILFEPEGVSGHFEPSAAQGQGTAEDSQGSVGRSGETIKAYGIDHAITTGGNCTAQGSCVYEDIQATLKASGPHAVCYAVPYALKVRTGVTVDSAGKAAGFDGYNADLTGEKSSTLGVNCGMSTGRTGVILKAAAFMGGQGAQDGSIAYTENCSPTLRATESGTLQAKPNGGFSHNFINPIVYHCHKEQMLFENHSQDTRYKGPLDVCPMLPAQLGTGGNNTPFVTEKLTYCKSARAQSVDDATTWKECTVTNTLNAFDVGEARCNEVVCICNGQMNQTELGDKTGALNCMHDQQEVMHPGKPPRKWIVRRLTPTECARLQGFPDMHGHPDHKDSLTDDEYAFWLNVRNTHAMINGRAQKQYTREQMLKWYNGLHTDSAEYKMWGNGIALPCAAFVLGQIARWGGEENSTLH